jgi:transcription antitermination factor NusG
MAVACLHGLYRDEVKFLRSNLVKVKGPRKMSHPWFALQVRSRYENIVTAHLSGKGYECFLPLYICRRRWSDRFKDIKCPLFPGYVFCRFNPLDRLPIRIIPGVVLIVGLGNTPVAIDEREIAAIQSAVKSGLPSQPWPFMQIGQKVRVEHGPLSGLDGVLSDFRGQHRLVLSVTLLKRSIVVQVENSWVTPIPQHPQAEVGPPSIPGKNFGTASTISRTFLRGLI